MSVEKLRQAHQTRPFRPFTIVTGDGSRYAVPHPEMLAMNPKAERTFILHTGRGEEHVILDLLLVTALEFGNGQVRHRRTG